MDDPSFDGDGARNGNPRKSRLDPRRKAQKYVRLRPHHDGNQATRTSDPKPTGVVNAHPAGAHPVAPMMRRPGALQRIRREPSPKPAA
jgi:hypothetical protein